MGSLKLGVEVVGAHRLMPKDGQGSSNSFVELHFDGQRFRTTIKEKDLNPVWNESFYFNISNPDLLPELPLDAFVYSINRATNSNSFLGKVRLSDISYVPITDAVELAYPLQKRSIFSRVSGELFLKVYVTDDPSVRLSNPIPALDALLNNPPPAQTHQAPTQIPSSGASNVLPVKKSDTRHTFNHLPKEKQRYHSVASVATEPAVKYAADGMKPEPPPPRIMKMNPSQQPVDFALKETSPFLGGGRVVGGRVIRAQKPASTYDLVEQMSYLFVRVVKARDLPSMDLTGSLDPYVEIRVGNYKGKTRVFEKNQNPEWNEVFAFSKERVQTTVLEVVVKDKDLVVDDFVGIVKFDLNDVPMRVPPDSPLAPEWFRLEAKDGDKVRGELMLAVWMGTQADEAFPDALHSDATEAADVSASSAHLRSKVYHAPRLWYVRVFVIETQDVVSSDKNRYPDVYVKAQIGHQIRMTRPLQNKAPSLAWNDEFMFVAAEPFEEHLIISVEERVAPNKDEVIGRVSIPLATVEKRADDRPIRPRWHSLEKPVAIDLDQLKKDKFSSRINLRVCLDGGYHVLDESTHYSSDLRPTAKQLWKPSIGLLELGILSADGLHPMKTRDGKGSSDTYCVAKYGHKWVRTRTVLNNPSPKFNEQYTWEVYDPATVLTVGVFDNSLLGEKGSNGLKDQRVGKVRIRLSTLETGRVYTHSYPLLVLHPSGLKKMGELHLAIRFSATSMVNMMFMYSRPLLPKMHYVRPIPVMHLDQLRYHAVQIVVGRLSRMEPPLRKEVVDYMCDVEAHMWSMRRSKANFGRFVAVFSGLNAVSKWFGDVCVWKNPITTVLVHVLFVMLVCFPELILPTIFLYMFLIGLWNYRYRPRSPPYMNTRISLADTVLPEELDEEFDTFPSSRNPDQVRSRYDKLRNVAGKIQTVVGDVATQGERLLALLSWRDPRATAIFMLFCLVTALLLYVTPFQVVAVAAGFFVMRHPRFRYKLPSVPISFFRRLPARTDSML